jgi:hypothetical protein
MSRPVLALTSRYEILFHQNGLGRECVAVRLLDNEATPYATYELAGEAANGARHCIRGDYVRTELEVIHSIGRRTGTNLAVGAATRGKVGADVPRDIGLSEPDDAEFGVSSPSANGGAA